MFNKFDPKSQATNTYSAPNPELEEKLGKIAQYLSENPQEISNLGIANHRGN
jgi:hypothetical protein